MSYTESKYAKTLTELGFERFENKESASRLETLKELLRQGNQGGSKVIPTLGEHEPSFIAVEAGAEDSFISLTVAIDETGEMWRKFGEAVDLSTYGFTEALKPVSMQ